MAQKNINIFLKEKTHTDAKIGAILKKTTLNDFFIGAIEASVSNDEKLIEQLLK